MSKHIHIYIYIHIRQSTNILSTISHTSYFSKPALYGQMLNYAIYSRVMNVHQITNRNGIPMELLHEIVGVPRIYEEKFLR